MEIDNKEFFGLQECATGELVRIQESGHDNFELSRDTSYPVFQAQSLDQLSDVLREDTPFYNTDPDCPGWGPFSAEQLRPVKLRVTTALEPLQIPLVRRVKSVETRDIAQRVAFNYAGGEFELVTPRKSVVFWLATLAPEQSFDEVKGWEGSHVFGGDRYTRRHVYKVLPVPEEYVPLLKGKPGALLIASELQC